jgi:hypothetical protein
MLYMTAIIEEFETATEVVGYIAKWIKTVDWFVCSLRHYTLGKYFILLYFPHLFLVLIQT